MMGSGLYLFYLIAKFYMQSLSKKKKNTNENKAKLNNRCAGNKTLHMTAPHQKETYYGLKKRKHVNKWGIRPRSHRCVEI